MNSNVLLGDEALALGALHAGLSAAFGYPGTPSTEILEYLIDNYEKNRASGAPVAQWCSNEKTAYESALGVSFSGKRALVTMKHVGLNVAADPFMNSSAGTGLRNDPREVPGSVSENGHCLAVNMGKHQFPRFTVRQDFLCFRVYHFNNVKILP